MLEIFTASIQWVLLILGFIILYYSFNTFILAYKNMNSYQKKHINNAFAGAKHNPNLAISSESTEGLSSNKMKTFTKKTFFGLFSSKKGLEVYGINAQSRLQSLGWK